MGLTYTWRFFNPKLEDFLPMADHFRAKKEWDTKDEGLLNRIEQGR